MMLCSAVLCCAVLCCDVLCNGGAAEESDPSLLSPAAREGLALLDEQGGSALTTAIRGNHSDIALLLLRLGADPNAEYTDSSVRRG